MSNFSIRGYKEYFPGKMNLKRFLKINWGVKIQMQGFAVDTVQKLKFSIKDFFSKCDQISSFLRIWLHLLKKSLIENFIFCAVGDFPYFDCLKTFENVFRLRLWQCTKLNLLKNRNEMDLQKWIYKIENKIKTDLQIFLMQL